MNRYAVSIERELNCFDAWVASSAVLWRRIGGKWHEIDSRSFDAIISRMLSLVRAELVCDRWRRKYDAERI